ncbi:MAG TPA: amidohydrolase family protein [Stellaceae bacterium]|nr:amidohydrolase family protein [Stellaceae bacterium]
MLIVDAQIHLWSKGTTLPPHRPTPYSMAEALADMDAAGVDRALIHPPSWDPDSNELAVAAARAYPERFAILGNFPLDRPESRALVAGWKSRPGMLGLRFTFLRPEQKSWPYDGTMDWLWPAAERAGLPVALLAGDFLPLVGQVAERHPGLKLLVDHMAAVRNTTGETAFQHLPELLALARYPNIAVKATGGPSYAADPYPFRSLHPYYRRLYDAFGPRRLFWGTDITRMPCSWRQCVTAFTEEMTWLPEADKALVMGRALCDWIGWA